MPWMPFVKSEKLMGVLAMAQVYQCRPSTLICINDEYTAYCFDQVCAYIRKQIEDGLTPVYKKKVKSLQELYDSIEF